MKDIKTELPRDLMGRHTLIEKIARLISRLSNGSVIAIDGEWGDGKTWFGRAMYTRLSDATGPSQVSHRVGYIDAFSQDFVEDPFIPLVSELKKALPRTHASFWELSGRVAGGLLPTATKIAMRLGCATVLGDPNFSDKIRGVAQQIGDDLTDQAEAWSRNMVAQYQNDLNNFQNFRSELEKAAASEDVPIVIFIDELDRCKPSFAVQLLERIKHFFDVPNLVFILLINRRQLERSIEGVYGDIDSTAYLGKFINFFFRIHSGTDGHHLHTFADSYSQSFKLDTSQKRELTVFLRYYIDLARQYKLSLRDIQRGIDLYMFRFGEYSSPQLMAYAIVLKQKFPDIFNRMRRGIRQAHHDALTLFKDSQIPDINNLFVKELHIGFDKNYEGGEQDYAELRKLEIQLTKLKSSIVKEFSSIDFEIH